MHLVAQLAAAVSESEGHGNVAMETLPVGLIALGIFGVLALVCVSYRNVSNRHADAHDTEHGH